MPVGPGFVADIGHESRNESGDNFGGQRLAGERREVSGKAQDVEDADVDDVGNAANCEELRSLFQ